MTRDSEKSTTTAFKPHDGLSGLAEYLDLVPHYLFRISSPRSSGMTTETSVVSEATKRGVDKGDILDQDREKAVKMLENHLLWRVNWNDNLMSWTSSFLFAMQHAIRREVTDIPSSAPESIQVWVLDARKVPRGSFLPAVALLRAYNIKSEGKLEHEYYYGEYLSQGRMNVPHDAMVMTTLKALVDHGLYKLYPPFAVETKKKQLCRRVLQLRDTFKHVPERPTREEVSLAEKICVGCFLRIDVRPVIMMILLSLKPRFRLDGDIMEAFRENCWGI